MPVNLLDIQKKLTAFGEQAKARQQAIVHRQQEVTDLLENYAHRQDELIACVNRAAAQNPNLRCAVPRDEPLNSCIPKPDLPPTFTLLAADGSQINPSRHTRVQFCVINVGMVKMVRGSSAAPEIMTQSHLLDYDAIYLPNGGMVSEGMIALKRDLREREALAELAGSLQHPAISMTDGPLELYHEYQESSEFTQTLEAYIAVLNKLRNLGLITLGYVDKPGSDLIGRLLELVPQSSEGNATPYQRPRRFVGVSDVHLVADLLIHPGDRSALFAICSPTAMRFGVDLLPHFFYLNVGQAGRPHLARVEVPGWVARQPGLVGLLQAVLTEQSAILGTRPYPYILHRAHEVAVVTMPEHQHVEEMIVSEFNRRGIPVDEGSYKQYHKDLPKGRTRYQG